MPKLCVLANTKMRHDWLRVPRAVLTVHAGNFSRRGTLRESIGFVEWFGALPGMKVLVAGAADLAARDQRRDFEAACAKNGIVYLAGDRATVAGLRIWGGPGAPPPHRMDLDLLLTHEAPFGIGDRRAFRSPRGSLALLRRVHELRPRAHVFCGSTHEAGRHLRGELEGTVFLNAALAPLRYLLGGPLTHDLRSATAVWNDETTVTR